MDGTFYLGNQLLPGAIEFIEYLKQKEVQFLFLTNNSSNNRIRYAEKLRKLGAKVSDSDILTSGEATAIYLLSQKPNPKIYLVGTPALEEEFQSRGFLLDKENPDYAVLGFDTTLTYQKIWHFCDLVRQGVPYIATHPDINCPTKNGFMPDTGSMIEMIASSTGKRPDIIIGKPNHYIVDAVATRTHLSISSIAMVGDRLYTDIALGQSGVTTILVLSGETRLEDLKDSPFQPDFVMRDLADLLSVLQKAYEQKNG